MADKTTISKHLVECPRIKLTLQYSLVSLKYSMRKRAIKKLVGWSTLLSKRKLRLLTWLRFQNVSVKSGFINKVLVRSLPF